MSSNEEIAKTLADLSDSVKSLSKLPDSIKSMQDEIATLKRGATTVNEFCPSPELHPGGGKQEI